MSDPEVDAYSSDALDEVMQEFLATTEYVGEVRPWRTTPETAQDSDDDITAEEAVEVWKREFDESKHPRDKEGQFTEAGPGDSGMRKFHHLPDGKGPAYAKWLLSNIAADKASEAFLAVNKIYDEKTTEKDAHLNKYFFDKEMTAGKSKSEIKYEMLEYEQQFNTNPEYVALYHEKKRLQGIAEEAQLQRDRHAVDMRIEIVTNLAGDVAKDMGIDPSIIEVVHQQARKFEVGGHKFTEAGHYTPNSRKIQLNAGNITLDVDHVKGITAHEISHLMYHSLKDAAEVESQRYKQVADYYNDDKRSDWFYEHFDQPHPFGPVTIKPEKRADIEREFPASAVWAKLNGGQMFSGISDDAIKEDGHSQYAESYWEKEAVQKAATYDKAINETTAEITRYMRVPDSWNEKKTPDMNSMWGQFTTSMHAWYKGQQERIAESRKYHPPDAKGRKYGEPGYNT